MHGKHRRYESPLVRDYGDLREITASFRTLVGVTTTDLSFSGPGSQPGGGGVENRETGGPPPGGPPPAAGQEVLPDAVTEPRVSDGAPDAPDVSGDADAPGGADSPGGEAGTSTGGGGTGGGGTSGGGGAGDGGSLPFTGLAAGAVAAAGSALAAAGTALRRRMRRPPERDT